jgi:hypothetical protein
MALTPEQVRQYQAEEGPKAAPLSPLDWLKKQEGTTQTSTQKDIGSELERIKGEALKIQEQISPTPIGESMEDDVPPALDTGADDVQATLGGVLDSWEKSQRDYDSTIEKMLEQQRESTKQKQSLMDKMTKVERPEAPDMAKITEDTLAKYGLTPEKVQQIDTWMGEVKVYQQQMADLEAQKQAAMGTVEQTGMPQDWVLGRQALTERQYNSRIAAKSAQADIVAQQIQLQRGLFDDARATSSQIVNAITYDYQQRVADFEWQRETYMDLYNMMDQDEQLNWNRAYELAQTELQRETQKAQQIMELRLNTRGEAGIQPTDTLEEATEKYNQWQQSQPADGGWQDTGVGPGTLTWINQETGERTDDPWEMAKSIVKGDINASEENLINAIRSEIVDEKGNSILSVGDAQRIVRDLQGQVEMSPEELKEVFQVWKDNNMNRQDAEAQWRADNPEWPAKADIPEPEASLLDEVFGPKPSWWQFWK